MRILLIACTLFFSWYSFADDNITFIVNTENSVTHLSQQEVSDLFFKVKRDWRPGLPVRFYDRKDDSTERKIFLSSQYINKTNRAVELFWIGQKLSSGNSAPTQISSDSMMVYMVSKFPGAIGYVSSSYGPLKDVKKVEVDPND